MPMRRNFSSYWKTNIFETTSGNFATPVYHLHADEIGLNRILYSVGDFFAPMYEFAELAQVDYPFVPLEQGAAWLKSLAQTMDASDVLALKRGLAVKVLHLNR
jgi:2,3-dihydroxybenzoate decarboxylase